MTFTADHVTAEWQAKLAARGRERSIACGWTTERVDLLKKLWADGLSCSQIAARLGGFTRNAVIGKVHRLGLSARATTERKPRVRSASARKPRAPKRATRRLPGDEPYTPLALAEIAAPDMRPCGLLELAAGRCRFPVGHPGDPGFFYCGGDARRDKPYCAYHCAIAYTAPAGPRSTAKKSALTELWR